MAYYDPISYTAVPDEQVSHQNAEPESGIFNGGYGYLRNGNWTPVSEGTPDPAAYFSNWNNFQGGQTNFGDSLQKMATQYGWTPQDIQGGYNKYLTDQGLDPYLENAQSGRGVASAWWGPQKTLEGILTGMGRQDLISQYINPQLREQQQQNLAMEGTNSQNSHWSDMADLMQVLAGVGTVLGAGAGAGAFAGEGALGAGSTSAGWTSGYDLAGGGGFGMADAPIAGAGWTPDEWMSQVGAGGGEGGGASAGGALDQGANTFVPQLANASDPIEAINTAMNITGADTATGAAQALGYASPEELVSAINPAWGSGAAGASLGAGGSPGGSEVTGGANGAPATPTTASPATPTPTKEPNLMQLFSKLGNGTTPSDIMNYLRANPTSLMSPMGGGGPVSNGINMLSSLYGMGQSKKTKQLADQYAQQADPFADQRRGYAQQLASLMQNPSSLSSTPGYQAGLDAVTRKMAAAGYLGSGNMMKELADYGTNAFTQQAQLLSQLAGANANPAAAGQIALQGNTAGNNLMSQALAALGYGTRMFGF